MAKSIKCADRKRQTIYVNIENAITLFRRNDLPPVQGAVVAFLGGKNDAVIVQETPERILELAANEISY